MPSMRRACGLWCALVSACSGDPAVADTNGGPATSTGTTDPAVPTSTDVPGVDSTGSDSGGGSSETGATACDALDGAVTAVAMRVHLEALEEIAIANDNNRSVGTPGYDRSADYVRGQLEAAGYVVEPHTFEVNVFIVDGPASLAWLGQQDYVEDTDFRLAIYSGPGSPTAIAQAVDVQLGEGNASTSGCEPADFAGFAAGSIAVLQRGTCLTADKVVNAQDAGAVGVVLFNQGNNAGRTGLWFSSVGATGGVTIPVVLTTYDVGVAMAQAPAGSVSVAMDVDVTLDPRPTTTIVVETPGGDPNETVMLGAHLDSVAGGPGINDNGTGSAALLEVARALAGCEMTRNVRFAWWAAEEVGLVGSSAYVEQLDAMQRASILTYMNFDMIGSPNFVRFRYDGDGSAFGTAGPMGSAELEQVFADYFDGLGLPSEETAFDGRSDYGPFVLAGIAAGGLFTGAEGVKSPEQARLHGGQAGEAYDACYHGACDGADNVNDEVLGAMGGAIAHAVQLYAMP